MSVPEEVQYMKTLFLSHVWNQLKVRQGVGQSDGGKNITFVAEKEEVADFILAVFTKWPFEYTSKIKSISPFTGSGGQSWDSSVCSGQFSSVQWLSPVQLFATPWIAACQASLSITKLPELTQTHVHWVSDAIQSSHPLSSPSPPTFNFSQHQGLFKWVSSLNQVAKILEFWFQHQSFQWIFRTACL